MSEIDGYIEWMKEKPDDKVWWGTIFHGISEDDINDSIGWGDHIFSFDKHKIYWLFRDYPDALTNEEKEAFDKENPFWKSFFKNR